MSNNDPTYALDPSKLPPALLAVVPALAPPPGVTPNFIDPPSREDLGKGFVYAFLPIMVCFVTLRMYTRARISRTFGLDDCKVFTMLARPLRSLTLLRDLRTRGGSFYIQRGECQSSLINLALDHRLLRAHLATWVHAIELKIAY